MNKRLQRGNRYVPNWQNTIVRGLDICVRTRVRTVEYFKFPNLEGATVWEKLIDKGGTENEKKIFLKKSEKFKH